MLLGYPTPPTEDTPQYVGEYLRDNGWVSNATGTGKVYWQDNSQRGYYTWEQALVYTIFRKLHLRME